MRGQWSGVIAVEGGASVDGRLLRSGALTWELESPLPLTHEGAVVGSIDSVRRVGGELHAEGVVNVEVQVGQPLAVMIDGVALGNSTSEVVEFTHGRIRSVELTDRSAWGRCRVTRVAY